MRSLAAAYFAVTSSSISSEYVLEPRQAAMIECLKAPHSQDFLYTAPISGLGQTMAPRDYRAVLSYRLMIPFYPDGCTCYGCGKVLMDIHGDHALHCMSDPGVKHRHDTVRDGLYDILRRAGIASKREASIGLSTETSNVLLRPADILVYNWLNGRNTCLDLTGCSPFVGFTGGTFDSTKALEAAVKRKYYKHDKACEDFGYEFLPFGFTTLGSLCEEAIEFMGRVEKVTHQHLVCYKSTKFVFHRLGFLIQKAIAAQLVSRLPVNFV